MFFGVKPSIHLVGIGGSGMSGIAEVLIASGFAVRGSDLHAGSTTERLKKLGAKIFVGHDASNIEGATCVVISSAVPRTNPEWTEALARGIPVIQRAEMLAELMRLKMGIAVAGSHGKTTTTSMIGQILRPLDPTVVVGGRLQHWNASSIVGRGSAFVIEADESDRSFLKFSPVYSVVTNVDREHLDTYRDLEDLEHTFIQFLNSTAFFGMNWVSADCPTLKRIRTRILKPTKTYGFADDADLKITQVRFTPRSSHFRLAFLSKDLGEFELPVVGKHNVQNAAAGVGIALSLNVELESIKSALRQFVPADRRLQIHFEDNAHAVIEDYGHHPTEIEATLSSLATMYPSHQKVIIFQPHRYTRTQALWNEFSNCFAKGCDQLILLPIYAAHEQKIDGVTSENLAKIIKHENVQLAEMPFQVSDAVQMIESQNSSKPKAVLILGAGPLTRIAVGLAEHYRSHRQAKQVNSF